MNKPLPDDKLPPDLPDDIGAWDDDNGGAGFWAGIAAWGMCALLAITAVLAIINTFGG